MADRTLDLSDSFEGRFPAKGNRRIALPESAGFCLVTLLATALWAGLTLRLVLQ